MTRPSDRDRLIRVIHVAKRQLKLEDAEYRAVLRAAFGKESCTEMTDAQLWVVIGEFERMGFRRTGTGAPDGKKSERKVIRLIFGLWTELGRKGLIENPSRPALLAFVARMTGVSHPDWLDNAQATKVVEALKAIRNRGRVAS
jgi:phage gp16-like protein